MRTILITLLPLIAIAAPNKGEVGTQCVGNVGSSCAASGGSLIDIVGCVMDACQRCQNQCGKGSAEVKQWYDPYPSVLVVECTIKCEGVSISNQLRMTLIAPAPKDDTQY